MVFLQLMLSCFVLHPQLSAEIGRIQEGLLLYDSAQEKTILCSFMREVHCGFLFEVDWRQQIKFRSSEELLWAV